MARVARESRQAGTREERGQEWAERARAWRESGQTQAAYCAAQGLSVWMLRKWIVDLGAKGRTSGSVPRLLPIALHPAGSGLHGGVHDGPAARVAQTRESEAGLEIALPNGTRIRAAGVSARELTRAIAQVLRC